MEEIVLVVRDGPGGWGTLWCLFCRLFVFRVQRFRAVLESRPPRTHAGGVLSSGLYTAVLGGEMVEWSGLSRRCVARNRVGSGPTAPRG